MVKLDLTDLVLLIFMKNSLSFFLDVAQLKILPRTGWVWRGIKDPETVAEHSFRLAFFVWILGKETHLNMSKAIAMAIIHDLCEAYAGDLTPHYGTPNHRKIKVFSQSRAREVLLKQLQVRASLVFCVFQQEYRGHYHL